MPRLVGILTTDARLVVTSWDEGLAAITGIAAADACGRTLEAIVPDLDARGLLPIIREPLAGGPPQVLAPALHHHLFPCPPIEASEEFDRMQQRVLIGALRDDDRIVGLMITVEDVTTRVERERRLARELRARDPAARRRAIEALADVDPVDGLGPIGDAIADEDWQVRRAAVRSLAGRATEPMVEALVSALRESHRNFSVLSSALQLVTLTGIDLTATLIDLLGDPDPDLRLQAALLLGARSSPAAVDALLGALGDPDVNVRFHAVESLGKLSPPSAVEPLAAIVDGRDFFLAFPALDALARINDPAVVPRLLPLLTDDMLAGQTADALAQIGDEDAVAPLVRALDREGAPVSNIVGALAAIERRYEAGFKAGAFIERTVRDAIAPAAARRLIDAVPRLSGASLRSLVVVLGWLRGSEVQRALTRLLGSPDAHHEAIEAIVRFGAPMVDRLVEQLEADDQETRRAAAVALGRIGDARAVPPLVARLDADEELRVPIAGALARIGDPLAFRPLLRLLGDANVSVRHAAIGALNSIGHADLAAETRRLLDSEDRRIRESAVKIAGYFGFAECAEGLVRCCRDEDEAVRAAALEHLGYLDDPRALPLLEDALFRDTPRARAGAAQALGYVDTASSTAALSAALADEDAWVRYFSAISLGRRRDASAIPALHRLLTGDAAQHVRIAAAEALGRIGGDAAVALLTPFVEDDDADTAIAAVRALGDGDVAAVEAPLRRAMASYDVRRRGAAIEAIVHWGREAGVDLLRAAASTDVDGGVARDAMAGLAALASRPGAVASQALAALIDLATEPSRAPDAIAAVATIPSATIPLLGSMLGSRDPKIRRAVVDAMGRLSHTSATAYLRGALDDPDALVRQKAIVALARVGADGLARKLAMMAHDDAAAGVRHTAESALRRYGSRDANGVQASGGEGQ